VGPRIATRLVGVVAIAAMAAAMCACDPYSSSTPGTADVDITLGNDGSARMQVHVPAGYDGDRERLGQAAADAVFPGGTGVRITLDNNAGLPFPVIVVPSAYRTGRHAVLTVDTSALQSVLAGAGLTTMYLTVCGPFVPLALRSTPPADSRAGRCGTWTRVRATAPRVTLDMRPSPNRWWAEMALIVLALAATVIAWTWLRRPLNTIRARWAVASVGVAGLMCGVVSIATAAGTQVDNLGVAGLLSGTSLQLAGFVGYLVLPLAIASMVAAIVAIARRPT
jgi:hypothetical protein